MMFVSHPFTLKCLQNEFAQSKRRACAADPQMVARPNGSSHNSQREPPEHMHHGVARWTRLFWVPFGIDSIQRMRAASQDGQVNSKFGCRQNWIGML